MAQVNLEIVLLLAVPVHQRFEFIQHLFGGCLIFAAREEVR